MDTALSFVKIVLLATGTQLLAIFGGILFFGLLLYFFARFTRTTFVKSIGQNFDIYFTGWIGVPIHELGHALFCLIFAHKIVRMKLFAPNKQDGSIGFVDHKYNPKNIWAVTGNFFIGFGPILLGSVVMVLLAMLLIPTDYSLAGFLENTHTYPNTVDGFKDIILNMHHTGYGIVETLFTKSNVSTWQFWLFLYLSISIASHMQLSPSDLKGAWKGLLAIIILLLLINVVCVLLHFDIIHYTNMLGGYASRMNGVFMFSAVLSALFFASTYVLLNVYTLISAKKLFHPFG